MSTALWVIGARGLLGASIHRAVRTAPDWTAVDIDPLPWSAPDAEFAAAVRRGARTLGTAAGTRGRWAIVWSAGAVVTSSDDTAVDAELARIRLALATIAEELGASGDRGALFFASSAGGVYAGSVDPPFTENTEPRPLSPYGRLKLEAEQAVAEAARSIGSSAVLGRIANLYGPGQRLDKLQGLISHLALARVTARPASIYVSLDTLRDYVYVDDASRLVLASLQRAHGTGDVIVKIIGSGDSTSIAALLGHFRVLSKGRPLVLLGSSPQAARQALDLRLRSVVWPDLRPRPTGLPEGIRATIMDIERVVRAGV